MVVTHIKNSGVNVVDITLVSIANCSSLCPIHYEGFQLNIVINGIVIEFFFLNLFQWLAVLIINPVNEVHYFHASLNQLDFRHTRDDTQRYNTLAPNYYIMKLFNWRSSYELNKLILMFEWLFSFLNCFIENLLQDFA